MNHIFNNEQQNHLMFFNQLNVPVFTSARILLSITTLSSLCLSIVFHRHLHIFMNHPKKKKNMRHKVIDSSFSQLFFLSVISNWFLFWSIASEIWNVCWMESLHFYVYSVFVFILSFFSSSPMSWYHSFVRSSHMQ